MLIRTNNHPAVKLPKDSVAVVFSAEITDFVTLENVDSLIGKSFLVTKVVRDSDRVLTLREVYRLDGFEVYQPGGEFENVYLTPHGYKKSMAIYDRDPITQEPIWAYERTRIYKTLEKATKDAKKHNGAVMLLAVQCPYDNRREPHCVMSFDLTAKLTHTMVEL